MTAPAFAPDYPVVTERLTLRPFDPVSDVDPMHAYRSRPDVCRYAPIEPRTRQEVADRLRNPDLTRSVLEAEGDILSLAVEVRNTNQMIGDVVLFWRSTAHRQGRSATPSIRTSRAAVSPPRQPPLSWTSPFRDSGFIASPPVSTNATPHRWPSQGSWACG